jgi:hypothetical protein
VFVFAGGARGGAVTVGASDENDRAWVDGMTGRCVDLFAPGVGVLGASHVRRDAFAEWTGTSMAAPAVAGAILASRSFDGTDGRGAAAGVLDDATDGALWDEWDEVDAFSDDARDGGRGRGWGNRTRRRRRVSLGTRAFPRLGAGTRASRDAEQTAVPPRIEKRGRFAAMR